VNPKFTIRHIAVDGPHTYVQAQLTSPRTGAFSVGQGSRLGVVRLKSFLSEDPASSLFTFQIEDPVDAAKLRVGDTVDLIE
jgi:hypothetical protein